LNVVTVSNSSHEPPVVELRRGAALWLVLNSQPKLNALSAEMVGLLDQGLDQAEHDSGIKVVVVSALGRAFCAGADLQMVSDLKDVDAGRAVRAFRDQLGRTFRRIETFPKPVVAAVRGIAVAGGLELALCCDFIWAAEGASFGDAHANYGLLPAAGSTARLPRRIGASRAKQLIFTGDVIPARRAAEWGLINELSTDEEFDDDVDAFVTRLASRSTITTRRAKELVNDSLEVPQSIAIVRELEVGTIHEQSNDYKEGLAAFVEKREPRFTEQ
jgi:enoyl-CoA hydratase/carnithine racemase